MTRTTAWSRFPLWLGLAMGLVFAVNIWFIQLAVTTFPGAASRDDFDTSNGYNRILANVDRQNALGWQVRADGTTVALTDKQGAPLAGAAMSANARRPLGDEADIPVTFSQSAPGRFTLATTLRPGQWDLLLDVSKDGHTMRVTRRVLVP